MISIDETKLQVFLCSCPANFPFWFAKHLWFEVNDHGTLTRYEILFYTQITADSTRQHLFTNAFKHFQGIEVFPFLSLIHWPASILKCFEGSLAVELADVLEKSLHRYPHKEIYVLSGPNSNTYVQWVFNQLSTNQTQLPKQAIGARYLQNHPK